VVKDEGTYAMETKKTYQIVEVVLLVLTLLFSTGGCERELTKSTELTESAEQTQSSNETALAGAEAEELGVIIERNVPLPMRDGTILRADVHRPDRGGPYPVLVRRTPYGKDGDFNRFVKAGYIVVSQDVRGRYESDGKYESGRRFNTHDAEDGYDTVEWAAKLPGSTGKVGTFGTSALAFMQWRLAPLRPSSLVAMSACSAPARIEEDVGEGTLRPRRLWGGVTINSPESRRRANSPGVHVRWEALRLWDEGESEKWIHWLPWLELPQEIFEDKTEDIKYTIMNPQKDPWRLDAGCKDIVVPNLEIVGWFDMANNYMRLHSTLVLEGGSEEARRGSRIIIGPWGHGYTGRRAGKIDFGPSAALDISAVRIHWFDYWLKSKQSGIDKEASVKIFVMGDNRWRDEQCWPLQRTKEKILFITSNGQANTSSGNGKLGDEKPQSLGIDNYVYNPRDPVPSLNPLSQHMEPADQRSLAERQDILVYQTEPLNERLEVTGFPVIELYAESSAPDTDWFVKLIDVSPDGLALDVSTGVLRARYRNGLDKPGLIEPGKVYKYTIRMRPTSNAFLPGHRIRLDITSSDFPQYDRNHNTAADQNADATLAIANQTIYHGGEHATRIILPWVPNPTVKEEPTEEEKPEPKSNVQMYSLHQAAADGDIEQVKLFISKGADINAQDEKKNTPLCHAVRSGKMEIVQLFVEAGADVNAKEGNYDRTPLYMAVIKKDISIAEYLIAHGADVNVKSNLGITPLHVACSGIRRIEAVRLLIAKGADINAMDDRGMTPLRCAAWGNSIDAAKLLIAKGADINAGAGEGTALHTAVYEGRRDMVKFLIEEGADINVKDSRGKTPLDYAARAGRTESVKLLLEAGADVNVKDSRGKTPLDYAFSSDREDIAELLIAKSTDLDSKDGRGLTALHNAAVGGNRDITEMLLSKGAKVDERDDNYEFTALHYAARFGNKNVAEVLIAHGADINTKDKWDYQPIHWAAHHDRADVVELLISKGADVNAKTSLGQTPIQLAKPRRNKETVELLRKHGAKE